MSEARLVYSDDRDLRHAVGGRWLTQRDMARERERVAIERARANGQDMPKETNATAAGDRLKLRGLPAHCVGMGAIKNTQPGECQHGHKGSCFLCR